MHLVLESYCKLHASNISSKAHDASLSSLQAADQVFAMKCSAKLDDYYCPIVPSRHLLSPPRLVFSLLLTLHPTMQLTQF